jgi:hypothetical protein
MLKHLTLACLVASAGVLAQESKPIPKDSVEVVARGCLKGRVFTGTGQREGEAGQQGPDVSGRSFRVSGPREVMSSVKQHDGHLVDVVGIVRKAALDDQGVGFRMGRGTRVVIGGAVGSDPTRMNSPATAPSVPTMDLTVVRYVDDRCPIG